MAFPTTSILDDFNRANGPLGANWLAGSGIWDVFTINTAHMYYATGANGIALDTWSTQYGPDCEAFFTLTNLNNTSFTWGIDFLARCNDVEGNNSANYYDFQMGGSGLGVSNYAIVRSGPSGYSSLKSGTLTVSNGDKFGIEVIGSVINVYQDTGSGWTLIDTATDSDVAGAGYIALEIGVNGSVTVDDFGGGNVVSGPTAAFSGTPVTGAAPLTVVYTDESTGTPTSWLWDFGDSTTSTDQNPTHVYSAIGTYTVALTVTNDDGSDTETKTDYITVFGAPVADFSGTPTSGDVPLSVAFTDASTNSPSSWFWDFGDGGSSTSQNPTYVYNYIGTYTVTLTATNSAGSDSETKVAYITVTAVTEYGASIIENCDIDTGGLAVGLRVADVAYARDSRLGSLTIDASAELRVKDNSYATLVLNGTLTSLAGDRSVWDTANFPNSHASDISGATYTYHNNPSIAPATAYTSTAINLALNNTHHHVRVTAAVTITLPTAASIAGHEYIIKATVDSVLVDTTSSQTIDGDLTKTLNTNDCLVVFSDGSNWLIG